jgi:hypothetical protein
MSKPLGVSPGALWPGALAILAVLVTGLALAGQRPKKASDLQQEADQNTFWAVAGPPCPQERREAFQAGLQPRYVFDFNNVTFARAYGEADCRAYGDALASYRKCMFTSPGVVRVKAGKAEAFYNPGIGRPATVTVEKGRISCVMASRVLGPAGRGLEVPAVLKGWLPQ